MFQLNSFVAHFDCAKELFIHGIVRDSRIILIVSYCEVQKGWRIVKVNDFDMNDTKIKANVLTRLISFYCNINEFFILIASELNFVTFFFETNMDDAEEEDEEDVPLFQLT